MRRVAAGLFLLALVGCSGGGGHTADIDAYKAAVRAHYPGNRIDYPALIAGARRTCGLGDKQFRLQWAVFEDHGSAWDMRAAVRYFCPDRSDELR